MKRIIAFAVALTVSVAAFSQDSSTTRPMGGDSMHHKMGGMGMGMHKMKDCIMMENGTPMVMKGGQSMPLSQTMTLSNGSQVMSDGTVKMKNGSTKTMKDGDCIYMDGTMTKMPMKGNMKMKKDSMR